MNNIFFTIAFFICLAINAQKQPEPIYSKISGKGDPIILIPGFTVPGESWSSLVNELEKKYECHVITLAGFAGKTPIEFPWLPKINEALKNYINTKQLKNVTVIGHSLGGTIALWLATRDDSMLSKIIVVDGLPASGAVMIPNYDPKKLVYDNPFNKQQLNMSKDAFEQLAAVMSKQMSINHDVQEKIKSWMIMSDRKTFVFGYTDYLKMDLRKKLHKITIPVTIIAADTPFGKKMVTSTYNNQYADLNNYDLIIAQNSGHFVMFDKPEWFIKKIQYILSVK